MSFDEVRVGDVCKLVNGKAFKPSDWSGTGHPIIRIQNLNNPTRPFNHWAGALDRQVLIEPGDLLFAWSGTPGTSFGAHVWSGPHGVLNQHIFRVDFDERIITREWWAAAVNARLNQLISLAHGGVGLKHVTRRMVDDLTIPLPPLEEQKRIAGILDQAAELCRLRTRALDKLNTLGQAIFHEMFGELIQTAHQSPELTLYDIVNPARGISYGIVQRGHEVEGGVPVVRISNLSGDRFSPEGIVRTSEEISSGYRRTQLEGGEIAISIRGTVGNVAIIPNTAKGWNISREVALIPLEAPEHAGLIWELLRHGLSQRFIKGEVRGVAQSGINLADLRRLPIPSTFAEMSTLWRERAANLSKLVGQAEVVSRRQEALFASLQHRAFRGELGNV